MGPPELPGGNTWTGYGSRSRNVRLQWGRRNYPAETDAVSEPASGKGHASMGPPELPGGNTWTGYGSRSRNVRLQWGRRNYPAETRARRRHRRCTSRYASMGPPELPGGNASPGCSRCRSPASLQWGRRNYPAETYRGGREVPQGGAGFNGAAGITRRKQGPGRAPAAARTPSFNGAAGITRRKPPGGRAESRGGRRASMGPPELPGGNQITKQK